MSDVQALTQWREALRMVQHRFVALAAKGQVLGFIVECGSREVNTPILDPSAGIVARALPTAFLDKHLFPVKATKRNQARFTRGELILGTGLFEQPRPVGRRRFDGGTVYIYGSAELAREYFRIGRGMIPLLSCVPRGVRWPKQTTIIDDLTWTITLFRWAVDHIPAFPQVVTRFDGAVPTFTSAMNLCEAAAEGVAMLLAIRIAEAIAEILPVTEVETT